MHQERKNVHIPSGGEPVSRPSEEVRATDPASPWAPALSPGPFPL